MSQNLIVLNEDSTDLTVYEAPFRFQTVTRPILVQHQFSSIAQIPLPGLESNKPVLVQLDVLVYKQGIWQKVGSTQIAGKDFESTAATTYFTFDVSSILSSEIKSGFQPLIYNYDSNFTIESGLMDDNNPGFYSVIKYKTQARSWFRGLSGNLILNETSPALESKVKRACNLYFHPKFKSPNKYANIPLENSVGSGGNAKDNHFMSQLSLANGIDNKKFLTNCPTYLKRKICLGLPLSLSATALNEDADNGTNSMAISMLMKYSTVGGNPLDSTYEFVPGNFATTQNFDAADDTTGFGDISTITLNPEKVVNAPSGVNGSNINPLIRFYLGAYEYLNGSGVGITDDNIGFGSLDFEIHSAVGSSSSNLPSINPNSCFIYFINDFNVLDYFAFTGEPDIVHEHSKNTFKRGYKDYTSRHSSNFGVSRGTTKEVYTCRELVNKETSEWLSEIYRSNEVYLWSVEEGEFVPILVLEGDSQPYYANRMELQPFSISFIKDTHIVKS